MQELLADWMMQHGFEVATFRQFHFKENIDVITPSEIIFDVTSENFAETIATVQLLKNQWPSARLTVLYNAPRQDEIRQLTQAGTNRVVAKPFFFHNARISPECNLQDKAFGR